MLIEHKITIPMFSSIFMHQSINLKDAVISVVDSNRFILSEQVKKFEFEFSQYIGVDYCVSVANGTDALQLALKSLDIGANDVVATVANAGFYSSTAIYAVGAKPLYVDVDPNTLTMSTSSLLSVFEYKKPKAVIVTHLYGMLAHIEEIMHICDKANIPVIEDCAQSHGATLNGKQAGSFGKLACFSFYPTKNLGALGDGGAIVTDDMHLTDKLCTLRQYGWSDKYHVTVARGQNSRLDEIQAAVLCAKLPYLDRWNAERVAIAKQYNDAFSALPVQYPNFKGQEYVAHLYVLRVKNRIHFREFLRTHGIATDIHYPILDNLQPAYLFEQSIDLVISESACCDVVSLPCFPGLMHSEVAYIIQVVNDYFRIWG